MRKKILSPTMAFVMGSFTLINAGTLHPSTAPVKTAALGDTLIINRVPASQSGFNTSASELTARLSNGLPSLRPDQTGTDVGIFYQGKELLSSTFTERKNTGKGKFLQGIADVAASGLSLFGKSTESAKAVEKTATVSNTVDRVDGTQVTVSLGGAEANTEISESRPVFTFKFTGNGKYPTDAQGLGDDDYKILLFSRATNPSQFILVKLNQKKRGRELVLSKTSEVLASDGIPDKYQIPIAWEQTSKGVFKVHPKEDLPAGEYGFMFSANSRTSTKIEGLGELRIFDFSIK